MAYISGCSDGVARGDLSPGPVIRFAHCRLRLCLRGKGSKAPLRASRSGCSDGVARGDLSPGPVIRFAHCRLRLCLRGKGSKVPLMAYLKGCSDGIARGHKAIKYPSHYPPAKPIRVPPFLAGRGVRGVGPDKERLFQFLKPRAYSAIELDFFDKPLKPVALLVNVNTT